jgi:hypothetical protein
LKDAHAVAPGRLDARPFFIGRKRVFDFTVPYDMKIAVYQNPRRTRRGVSGDLRICGPKGVNDARGCQPRS